MCQDNATTKESSVGTTGSLGKRAMRLEMITGVLAISVEFCWLFRLKLYHFMSSSKIGHNEIMIIIIIMNESTAAPSTTASSNVSVTPAVAESSATSGGSPATNVPSTVSSDKQDGGASGNTTILKAKDSHAEVSVLLPHF